MTEILNSLEQEVLSQFRVFANQNIYLREKNGKTLDKALAQFFNPKIDRIQFKFYYKNSFMINCDNYTVKSLEITDGADIQLLKIIYKERG